MIKINDDIVTINKFPDGTPRVNINIENIKEDSYDGGACIWIEWLYESNDEMFYLMLVKKHLERFFTNVDYYLYLPYIPNARMDRVKNNDEVFTLKYFCDFINNLGFSSVYVLDPHSDVSTALLNNCVKEEPKEFIDATIFAIGKENLVFYFPDAGAAKRYSDLFPEIPYCYGEKKRDWRTGKILGLDVRTNGLDLTGKKVLMIDDIIAYGGSLYYSAEELKRHGVNEIYAYATHTENSVLDKEKGTLIKSLENGTVSRLFTTNSLFNGQHEKITVWGV